MPSLLLIFAGCAGVIWIAGIGLSNTTQVLDDRLHLGAAIGGVVLLAIAINLPEIAITVAAAVSGEVGVAVGNILGGIAILTGLGMLLITVYLAGLILRPRRTVARMGPDSAVVLLLYVLGIASLMSWGLPAWPPSHTARASLPADVTATDGRQRVTAALARRLWQQYELIHDLIYFSEQARAGAAALGLRGFWMGYFAFRLAPLGPLQPAAATAVCYGFHPSRVSRALPDAWSYASPAEALAGRQAAADEALRAVLGPAVSSAELAEAAELAWAAAQRSEIAGRPLAAANQALPRPAEPHLVLWQAATVLREHRGDGHNAVLVSRSLPPIAAHLIKIAAGESDEQLLRVGRGFADPDWVAGRAELADRGLLDPAGRLTPAGHREHGLVERLTDEACAQPWQDEPAALRLLELLRPLADLVAGSTVVPPLSPVGVVRAD